MGKNEINANNSEGSINTINQSGGVNVVVNNRGNGYAPVIEMKKLKENQLDGDNFYSEYLLTIHSAFALPNLYLQINAKSIVDFDVMPQRMGGSMQGHTGDRDGFSFTNLQQAFGQYKIKVRTKKAEVITFEVGT